MTIHQRQEVGGFTPFGPFTMIDRCFGGDIGSDCNRDFQNKSIMKSSNLSNARTFREAYHDYPNEFQWYQAIWEGNVRTECLEDDPLQQNGQEDDVSSIDGF